MIHRLYRTDVCLRDCTAHGLAVNDTDVIPALVAGSHLPYCSGARGWLDAGDKLRHDNQ